MGAEYLSYVKTIATFALTFYGYIISVLASVIAYQHFLTGLKMKYESLESQHICLDPSAGPNQV